MDKIYHILQEYIQIEKDVSFKKMTTLRLGGNAKYVVYPKNVLQFHSLMEHLNEYQIDFKIFGRGSNILCSDKDYQGVIIKFDRHFNDFYFTNDTIIAEAGASIIAIAQEAMKKGLSGLEFASGIPGTVGGCTFMNAGAYKSSMKDVVSEVLVYEKGKVRWMNNEDINFKYRSTYFSTNPNCIIIAVKFVLQAKDRKQIYDLMLERKERRMNSQPLKQASCGSCFRNPENIPAWRLIDEIGYRGKTYGGIMVSKKHSNFIVNYNNGSATDFLQLADDIKHKVKQQHNIELKLEVEKFNW